MHTTPLQKLIEYQVTQGTGYDTSTTFTTEKTGMLGWLSSKLPEVSEERVHDSHEGLQTHLEELTLKRSAHRHEIMSTCISSKLLRAIHNCLQPEATNKLRRQYATLVAQVQEATTTMWWNYLTVTTN